MYAKIMIRCELEVLTGLHIGGRSGLSAIGAVNPVMKDPRSNDPIIPGSSLKGKLRCLLERSISSNNHNDVNKDKYSIINRLFGTQTGESKKSRLQFADAFILNAVEFKEIGLTEIKFENTIDRTNGIANPRQLERVNKGVRFQINIAYDMVEETELLEDMEHVVKAMRLLQLDYLGGHGTRGSGRVKIKNIQITEYEDMDATFCKYKDKIITMFKEVEEYEVFST